MAVQRRLRREAEDVQKRRRVKAATVFGIGLALVLRQELTPGMAHRARALIQRAAQVPVVLHILVRRRGQRRVVVIGLRGLVLDLGDTAGVGLHGDAVLIGKGHRALSVGHEANGQRRQRLFGEMSL